MRIACLALFLAFAGVTLTAVLASESTVVVTPGTEHWIAQPGGYSTAVLYGDPSKPGFYVMRLRTGANWTFPAHYHPNRENVTVISGVFYAGMGKTMNMSKMTAYPAGSFISLPAHMVHYAMTKQPAVIELTGDQPFADVMVK